MRRFFALYAEYPRCAGRVALAAAVLVVVVVTVVTVVTEVQYL